MPTLHIKLGSDGFRFFSSNKYHDIKCAFFEEKKNKIKLLTKPTANILEPGCQVRIYIYTKIQRFVS